MNDARSLMNALILSISSDIGHALSQAWIQKGWQLAGTYRTLSPIVKTLQEQGCLLAKCQLTDATSIVAAVDLFKTQRFLWDVCVVAPGQLSPVGRFEHIDFDEWENSIKTNFLGPLRCVHSLLSLRRKHFDGVFSPIVIFFAGAGTNGPAPCYSSYAVSKIALIKMCELLDAEIPDVRFVIVGPGWVHTKIHQETIAAGPLAEKNYETTCQKLVGEECTPMDKVIDCIDWLIETQSHAIKGRNFSVVHDPWGKQELEEALIKNPNMYKLRRYTPV